jgi:hypothetical protein
MVLTQRRCNNVESLSIQIPRIKKPTKDSNTQVLKLPAPKSHPQCKTSILDTRNYQEITLNSRDCTNLAQLQKKYLLNLPCSNTCTLNLYESERTIS